MNEATINLNCGNCGTLLTLHKPIMTRFDDGLVSTVMLVPSWSPAERKCTGCGFTVTPVFGKELPIQFVSMPPKQEERRIVTPGPLPLDVQRRLKTG
jgi:hypothetical protein